MSLSAIFFVMQEKIRNPVAERPMRVLWSKLQSFERSFKGKNNSLLELACQPEMHLHREQSLPAHLKLTNYNLELSLEGDMVAQLAWLVWMFGVTWHWVMLEISPGTLAVAEPCWQKAPLEVQRPSLLHKDSPSANQTLCHQDEEVYKHCCAMLNYSSVYDNVRFVVLVCTLLILPSISSFVEPADTISLVSNH